MIGRLTGKVLSCPPGQVLLDVAGVGYDVQIPLSTFYTLSTAPGPTVSLHVHTHVREDALQLYGFATREERAAFEQLISISGVGPRMALAILSGIGADELRAAVCRGDRQRLQRIPGVGKKTAERVLLELKDKLGVGEIAEAGERPVAAAPAGGVESDAISALVNLGYSREVAGRAVASAAGSSEEAATLESVLKGALAGLVR